VSSSGRPHRRQINDRQRQQPVEFPSLFGVLSGPAVYDALDQFDLSLAAQVVVAFIAPGDEAMAW
jgi:hypothetical protein